MFGKKCNYFVILLIIFVVSVSSCLPQPLSVPAKEIEVEATSASVPTVIQIQPTSEPTLI